MNSTWIWYHTKRIHELWNTEKFICIHIEVADRRTVQSWWKKKEEKITIFWSENTNFFVRLPNLMWPYSMEEDMMSKMTDLIHIASTLSCATMIVIEFRENQNVENLYEKCHFARFNVANQQMHWRYGCIDEANYLKINIVICSRNERQWN